MNLTALETLAKMSPSIEKARLATDLKIDDSLLRLIDIARAAKNFVDRCKHTCPNPSACWICDMEKLLVSVKL